MSLPKFNDERCETAFWQIVHYDRALPFIRRITKVFSENAELFGGIEKVAGRDCLELAAEYLEQFAERQRQSNEAQTIPFDPATMEFRDDGAVIYKPDDATELNEDAEKPYEISGRCLQCGDEKDKCHCEPPKGYKYGGLL